MEGQAIEWSDEDTRLLRTAAKIIGTYIGHEKFEQALRVSEERFRSLVENATDVIFSLSPARMLTMPRLISLWGVVPYCGASVRIINPVLLPQQTHPRTAGVKCRTRLDMP